MKRPAHNSPLSDRTVHFIVRSLLSVLVLAAMLAIGPPANAQESVYRISNRFIKAHVITRSNSGRFWITAGPEHRDSIRFLFMNSVDFVTSNLVFRVQRGTSIKYYCNQPSDYLPSFRPTPPSGYATFKPYDTMYVGRDTLLMKWRGMDGFDVTLRIIAEPKQTIYDSGGDLLLEFTHELQPFAPNGELGILMMLDTYNSQGGSYDAGGQGDSPSVLTSIGYLPVNGLQASTRYRMPDIPEWYHIGNFLYRQPLTDIFPIHRLAGKSHGGATLTPPNMFAVGHWPMLNKVAWDLPFDFAGSSFTDCAAIMRWEGLGGYGVVRTAFGLSDKQGNQNFTCRDDNIFVDIKAPRLITQAVKNGPYSQEEFDVEMWATNTSEVYSVSPRIRLQSPIDSYPSGDRRNPRLILDSSVTPAATSLFLSPKQTVKVRWRLKVNPLSRDTIAQLVFYRRYGTELESRFLEECNPVINVFGWQEPPPPSDTMNPRVDLIASGRNATVYWNFDLYDRHPGYQWDTGLKRPVEVLASANVNVVYPVASFPPCDVTQTVGMNVAVIDTSMPASYIFRVLDCAGNDSIASVSYAPRPDPFAPEHVVVVESGKWPGYEFCSARHFEHEFVDQRHQFADSGDYGFGAVVIGDTNNMRVVINGGAPIQKFQPRVSIVADVIDTMTAGGFRLHAFDFTGNDTVIVRGYCPVPDVLAPRGIVTSLGNGRYQVAISDVRSWDRGLRDVVEMSNLGSNMRIPLPPVIIVGDRTSTFDVQVVDLSKPGDIRFQVRDSVGNDTLLGIAYSPGTPPPVDTIAPDIDFAKVPGSNGADVIVTVDDEHFIDGLKYQYDTGLDTVRVLYQTPNIEVVSPISFFPGDIETKFRIRVIDTLAIGLRDTIVIGARDRAGNFHSDMYIYPILPDDRPPVFTGVMDAGRTTITAALTDMRPYDRGLGDLALENAVNLELRGVMPNLGGRYDDTVRFDVENSTASVSGTFVLRDLIATIDRSPEATANHIVRIPFSLPSVAIELDMPDIVEGGDDVVAAIISRSTIGSDVDSIGFSISYANAAGAPKFEWRTSRIAVATLGTNKVDVSLIPDVVMQPGDTLGILRFPTELRNAVYDLRVALGDPRVNGGLGRVFSARVGSDDEVSVLSLPEPLMRIAGDSTTFVNGDCDRVLTTRRAVGKPNALAILGMRPQPIAHSGGALMELDLRNLPATGAKVEFISIDGSIAGTTEIAGSTDRLARRSIALPELSHGTYALRITASNGVDQVMVVVVE